MNYTPGGQSGDIDINQLAQLLPYLQGQRTQAQSTQNNQSNDLFKIWQASQQSTPQALISAIPDFKYSQNLNQYMAPAQASADAMVDISSPQYQNIYNQQKLQGQQNLADQIAEYSRQNRKLSMMGRVPLFDQQRGGEQVFRQLTKGYQDIQNTAANQTQGILQNSYATQRALGTTRAENAAKKSSFEGNILGTVAKLFGL